MKILNVGCGNDYYGTDRIDIVKTEATTKTGDLEQGFPYPDNYFDEVYARSILEHTKNLKLFAEECYRVLKKGGKLFIRTDNAGYLPLHISKSHEHNVVLDASSRYHNELDCHYYLFVKSHLVYLFSKFKNLEFKYILGGRDNFYKFFLMLLSYHMGAVHIELRAIK